MYNEIYVIAETLTIAPSRDAYDIRYSGDAYDMRHYGDAYLYRLGLLDEFKCDGEFTGKVNMLFT